MERSGEAASWILAQELLLCAYPSVRSGLACMAIASL